MAVIDRFIIIIIIILISIRILIMSTVVIIIADGQQDAGTEKLGNAACA